MGLNDPKFATSSGEVLFRGEDLLKASSSRLRQMRGDEIAMIFQDPMTSLNPVHKIGRQLAEAVVLHQDVSQKQAYARALEMLKAVGIPRAERRIDDGDEEHGFEAAENAVGTPVLREFDGCARESPPCSLSLPSNFSNKENASAVAPANPTITEPS